MEKAPKTYSSQVDIETVKSLHPDASKIVENASGFIVFFSSESFSRWESEMLEWKYSRKRA